MKRSKKKDKQYWEMTKKELAEATREFDGESPPGYWRALTPEEQALWERMQKDGDSAMKHRRSSSFLSCRDMRLGARPIKIWAYDKSEKFVCRLEINAAGVAVYTGAKGGKELCNLNWEKLLAVLARQA